jgi:DNA-binding transcriptional LysR family regulator
MDRLTSMEVFVKSADVGSFAAAAEALALSPQMVAKHIASLETQLGTTLLNRTTRRQHLTDVGRAYYERCKRVLSEVEAADSLALDMHTQPKGVLKVSAPTTFGAFTMPTFVTQFLNQHPEMQIELSLDDRYVDPLEEGIEVMIRIGDLVDSSLIARELAPYRFIACASPDYLAKRGIPATPDDLSNHDCLSYSYRSPSPQCRWNFTRDGKKQDVHIDGRFRSNNWNALLHAATSGFGITLGPEIILANEVKAGRLVQVLGDYQGPSRPMHVVYPPTRQPTTKLRSFVDALVAEFGC